MKVTRREFDHWSVIDIEEFSVKEIKKSISFDDRIHNEYSGLRVTHLDSGMTIITYIDNHGDSFDWIAPTSQFVVEY